MEKRWRRKKKKKRKKEKKKKEKAKHYVTYKAKHVPYAQDTVKAAVFFYIIIKKQETRTQIQIQTN